MGLLGGSGRPEPAEGAVVGGAVVLLSLNTECVSQLAGDCSLGVAACEHVVCDGDNRTSESQVVLLVSLEL